MEVSQKYFAVVGGALSLLGAVVAAPVAAAATGPTLAVYFSAHPDDFVLFSLPYRDVVADNTKAVFIFTTAGDGGAGVQPLSDNPPYPPLTTNPYYLARENAAMRSIRFMADAARPWPEKATTSTATVNGHKLYKYAYRSTVAYFLRLPDGNGDGNGFPGTGNTSLQKLYTGGVASLKAIDNSTTYKGWTDLLNTVTAIVRSEAAGFPAVGLNANDIDMTQNVGDHSDHYATGMLATGVKGLLPCVSVTYYVGYSLGNVTNLNQEDTRNKTGSFASFASGLNENGYFGAWNGDHKVWLNGILSRTVAGNGSACPY
ncbi:MAG: hypothetical protein ACR650_14560 [Methylocystis sp.]